MTHAADPTPFALKTEKERSRPSAEARPSFQGIYGSISQFLDRELKTPEERIGAPPPHLERYLTDNEDGVGGIESVLVRETDIRWEIDVTAGVSGPIPNLGGFLRLQRLLAARALVKARRGETDAALQTLEAAWRLNEVLSATFAFEGKIVESPSVAFRLPLKFTAGSPVAPAPRAKKPSGTPM